MLREIATASKLGSERARMATPQRPSWHTQIVGTTGNYVLSRIMFAREILRLFGLVIKSYFLERGKGKLLLGDMIAKQVLFTGAHAFRLIGLVAILLGVMVGILIAALSNGGGLLTEFAPLVQRLMIELSSTTLSPLLITLIVIARSGTAIATELGMMRIRQETQIFDALGINIYYFLLYPRIVGMVVSLVCLTIYFNSIFIATHFVVVDFMAIADDVRSLSQVSEAARLTVLIQAVLKTGIIGIGIALISCYFGLSAKRAFTEVPQVATKAVVNCILFSVIANVVIFLIFYMLFGLSFQAQ